MKVVVCMGRRMVGYNISMRKAVEGTSPKSRQLPLYHKVSSPQSSQVHSPAPSTTQMERISGLITTSKHTRTIHITSAPQQPTQQRWEHNLDLNMQAFQQSQYTHVGQYGQRQVAVAPKDAIKMAETLRNIVEYRIVTALTAIRDHTPTRPLRQRIPTHYNNTPLELTQSLEKLDSEYVSRQRPSLDKKEGANKVKGWIQFKYLMQMSSVMRMLQKLTPVVPPHEHSLNNTNHQILDHHWHADYSPMNEVSLDHFPNEQQGGQSLVYTMEREDKKELTISTQSKFPVSVKALPLSNRQSAIQTVEHQKQVSRSSQQSNYMNTSPTISYPRVPSSSTKVRLENALATQCFTYEHLLPSQEASKQMDCLHRHSQPDQTCPNALLLTEILARQGLRREQKWNQMQVSQEYNLDVFSMHRQTKPHSPPPHIHINTKHTSPMIRPPTHRPDSKMQQSPPAVRFGPHPAPIPNRSPHPYPQPVQQLRPTSPPPSDRGKIEIVVTPPKRQPQYLSPPTSRKQLIQTQPPNMHPPQAPGPAQRGAVTTHQQGAQRTVVASPRMVNAGRAPSHIPPFNIRPEQQPQKRPMSPGGEYELVRPVNSHKIIPRPQSPVIKGPQSPNHHHPMGIQTQRMPVNHQHQQVRHEYFAEGPAHHPQVVREKSTGRPGSILQPAHHRQPVAVKRPTSPLPNMQPQPQQRHSSLANHIQRPFTPAPPQALHHASPPAQQQAPTSQHYLSDLQSHSSSKLSRPHSMTSKLSLTLKSPLL